MIEVRCRRCRSVLQAPEREAGTWNTCPHCGRAVKIPAQQTDVSDDAPWRRLRPSPSIGPQAESPEAGEVPRFKVKIRFVERPWETWGLWCSGVRGDVRLLPAQVLVTWVHDEDNTPWWVVFFFGWFVALVHRLGRNIGAPRNKLPIDPARSSTVYDQKRKEVSLRLPDDTWVALRLRGRSRRAFRELLSHLEAQFGQNIAPGRFGVASRGLKIGALLVAAFLAVVVLVGVLLYLTD